MIMEKMGSYENRGHNRQGRVIGDLRFADYVDLPAETEEDLQNGI